MNTISVYGRLASDVTLNNVSGQTCANFRVAAQTGRKDKEGKYMANFYNCSVWGQSAENAAKFLHKGNRITVSGELVIRDYTDKEGQLRTSVDINVRNFDIVETRSETDAATAQAYATPAAQPVQQPVAYAQPVQQPVAYAQPRQPQFTQVENADLPF